MHTKRATHFVFFTLLFLSISAEAFKLAPEGSFIERKLASRSHGAWEKVLSGFALKGIHKIGEPVHEEITNRILGCEGVRYVDDRLGGKVKPLIRFLKAWKYFRDVPISSFYLELRVAKYAAGEKSIIYDIDVKRVLRELWDGQLADMQDPMEISGYIPACKTETLRADALSKLITAVTRADKARGAASGGSIQDAFYWWRLLYNDQFPAYYY